MKAKKTTPSKIYTQVVNELNQDLLKMYSKSAWFDTEDERTFFTIEIDEEGLSSIYFGNHFMHKESYAYGLVEFFNAEGWDKKAVGGVLFIKEYIKAMYNLLIDELTKLKFSPVAIGLQS